MKLNQLNHHHQLLQSAPFQGVLSRNRHSLTSQCSILPSLRLTIKSPFPGFLPNVSSRLLAPFPPLITVHKHRVDASRVGTGRSLGIVPSRLAGAPDGGPNVAREVSGGTGTPSMDVCGQAAARRCTAGLQHEDCGFWANWCDGAIGFAKADCQGCN